MLWQKVGSRPYRYLAHAKPSWSMIISWGEVWGRDLSVCSQLRWPHQGTLLFCHRCACVRHTGALADKLSGCMLDLIPAGGVGFQRRFMGAGCIVILSIPCKIKPGCSLNNPLRVSPLPPLSCGHCCAVLMAGQWASPIISVKSLYPQTLSS